MSQQAPIATKTTTTTTTTTTAAAATTTTSTSSTNSNLTTTTTTGSIVQLDNESRHEIQENDKYEITNVQLDGMVLLKIINHCSENVPNVANGMLLGLNVKERLEVTNCFAMNPNNKVSSSSSGASDSLDNSSDLDEEKKYQMDMLKCLRDVNADNNTVGWYQSTYLESFMNLKTIDTQYQYQLEFGNKCIHLVLDPIRTRKGQLYIKAYRLTKRFFDLVRESYREQLVYKKMMEKYNAKEDELDVAPATITGTASAVAAAAGTGTVAPATAAAAAAVEAVLAEELLDKNSLLPPTIERVHIIQEAISKLNMSFNDILEEVPIIIHNSAMVHAFLYDLSSHEQFAATSTEFDNLDLSTTSFLEKSLESLLECSTDLTNERSRYQFYQRKLAHQKYQFQKKKDKSQEEQELLIRSVQQPSQLENLMITYQIDNTCKQVNRVSGEQISKLYLINHMFRRETEEQ